ncbi:MAG: M42 family peptidase [Lachnospiraceae bacterium]|nr:M42 family peptidase [Lachnospiraceae bacterium]
MDRDFLKLLLNTVSVSGNEEANQENALAFGKAFAHQQRVDAVGNVISVVNPDAACKVLLLGHMDEIGFRVSHIDDSGLIHVQKAGGVRPMLYVGAPMQIIHETAEEGKKVRRKVEGVGVVTDDLLKNSDMKDKDLLIDIGAGSREEAEAVVALGDSVCGDTAVHELLDGNFSCRALDDKTGAFVVLEAAKLAAEKGAKTGIYVNTAVGEETSGRGAYFAASQIAPSCAIAVDVTWASDCPGTDPAETGFVKLGGGPVLCLSGMVNKKMNALLARIAEEKGIPVQYEIAGGRTHTDGDTALYTGSGVPVALVSIPLRYMHSSVEVGNWNDIEGCIELIAEFLQRIDESFDYSPISLA